MNCICGEPIEMSHPHEHEGKVYLLQRREQTYALMCITEDHAGYVHFRCLEEEPRSEEENHG